MKHKRFLLLSLVGLLECSSFLCAELPGIRLHNGLPDGNYLQITEKSGSNTFMGDKAMGPTTKGAFSIALQDGVKATLLTNGVPSAFDYVEFNSLPDKWPNGVQKISIESHGLLTAECDAMTNCTVHFVGKAQ